MKPTWYLITNRITRIALKSHKGLSDEQKAGFWGAMASRESYQLLAEIRAEIAPQIQALRARQEVLESIGTRVNGGF